MGQALYRKYRSRTLDEIVGQEHITTTLKNAITSNKISHAYLFTGPHGVGKTSIARILAHEINGLSYDEQSASHLDIIEIDAASNRRIDEIRDLRDKVYIAPSSAKYKVYIIDEVHMLTKEAFNALLKTLEEPPAHVIFILATTDSHKLPETIISRTQRFNFRPVEKAKVTVHLKYIAKEEKIDIDDEAIEALADYGQGSFRDSISLLDQVSSSSTRINADDVLAALGVPPERAILDLIKLMNKPGSQSTLMQRLNDLYDLGYQASNIAASIGKVLRSEIITNSLSISLITALQLLDQLIEVPASHDPETKLTLIFLKNTKQSVAEANSAKFESVVTPTASQPNPKAPQQESQVTIKPSGEIPKVNPASAKPKEHTDHAPEKTTKMSEAPEEPVNVTLKVEVPIEHVEDKTELWAQLLADLKQKYNTLYGVIRMAQPEFLEDNTLRLNFAFAFHKKRVEEAKNQTIILNIIHDLSGENMSIECVVDKTTVAVAPVLPSVSKPKNQNDDTLISINNIFGGGEVLDSE
jgi:DNA polymerase-3 subunit gamma/tau